MIKLICLGSFPHGRHPIFIQELNRAIEAGEEFDGRDETFSGILIKKYQGRIIYAPAKESEKQKKNAKDKSLPSYEVKEAPNGIEQ
jgi:hypothetical protein